MKVYQMNNEDIKNSFQEEYFFSLQNQRNKWAQVAVASLAVATICILSLIVILPLKEVQPFVVMVDKTTGQAERIVQVEPAKLTEQDAVLQAALASYATDRETYDVADNERRILFVLERSTDQAAESLISIWSPKSKYYPPELYGEETRLTMEVKSISLLPGSNLARVRMIKTREEKGGAKVERGFVATIGYTFEPARERSLKSIWKNPLGFSVKTYRIDAETSGK